MGTCFSGGAQATMKNENNYTPLAPLTRHAWRACPNTHPKDRLIHPSVQI
jgi:hypothetical protein